MPTRRSLRLFWLRHKFKLVVCLLVLYFVFFTFYDVYFTTVHLREAAEPEAADDDDDPSESAELKF